MKKNSTIASRAAHAAYMRLVLVACMLLLASIPASSQMLIRGIGGMGGAGTPQFLLMVDGVNHVLQTNAVAKICLAGTC